jgi:ABC-type transport system involved in cytochrome c biogenesis permease component
MKKISLLLKKDIALLIREPSRLLISFIFILFSMILFNYAILSQMIVSQELIIGLFWILFIFALVLVLSAIIEVDQENANFQGIQISTLSPIHIYFERFLLILLILIITSIVIFMLISFLFLSELTMAIHPSILWIIIAIASLSSLISIMISIQNNNQIILYILFVILNTPLLLIGIQLSISINQNKTILTILSIGLSLLYFFIGIIFSEILLKGTHE